MPRINHVKKYQGKRKCQHPTKTNGSWVVSRCGKKKQHHILKDFDHEYDPGTLTCNACLKDINVGDAYKHFSIKTSAYGGYRQNRHELCPGWRPSQMTGNPKVGEMLAMGEAAEDAISALSEPKTYDEAEAVQSSLVEVASDAAEGIRGVAELYTESAENIEEGFGHPTWQSEEFEDAADQLETWADDVESIDVSEPEYDDEEEEEGFEMWFTNAIDAVQDELYNSPL